MSQAYKIVSNSSSCGKRKDIARHGSKGPLTAVLKKGDRVLIRNLSEKMTGKMRSFLGRQSVCGSRETYQEEYNI